MRFIYTFGVRIYSIILGLVAPFIPKAKDWKQGRKNVWTTLPDTKGKDVYWFHCASLGEFDQGLPVMNLLRAKYPEAFILVTFFSPSGFNHFHKRQHPADFVSYIPVDTKANATRFVNHFKPKATFFVKYEFWINHIDALKTQGYKLYSISTALRPKQHFFKWYGGFFRNALKQFDYFFAQNQLTVDLLKSIGISNVEFTGDTRFDRVIENKQNLVVNQQIVDFVGTSKNVFIAGSTWPKDEEVLQDLLNSNRFEKYIIAPHNVDSSHVEGIEKLISNATIRLSKFDANSNAKVLIIDSIGQLASAYSLAKVAYVGGGFSGSLHNILEPAVFGLPVIFGPKHSRFPEGTTFIEAGIGFSIQTKEELNAQVEVILSSFTGRPEKSVSFVEKNQGAAQKIIKLV